VYEVPNRFVVRSKIRPASMLAIGRERLGVRSLKPKLW